MLANTEAILRDFEWAREPAIFLHTTALPLYFINSEPASSTARLRAASFSVR